MNSRIILADDHVMVRQGVKTLLSSEAGFEIVAEAASGVELIAAAKRHQPDLVISDIAMPYGSGLETVTEVARWAPEAKIILLTGLVSRGLLTRAVQGGVDGVFLKSDAPETFLAGVRSVLAGERVVSDQVTRLYADSSRFSQLTTRELQVLYGLANGQTNTAIADQLGISPKTVDKHRTALMRKLGVNSLAQVLAIALREGLLDTVKSV